ncbi:cation diffusion facilitator family transporter [Azospirillum sp. SYSU D00513]|uniref:cation diffusion facilitator family transporter n=1 Tax=Azospirillum sp. SYSU D00513 TaxID=2812561 RepID=UPI001FFEFC2E|nr:cation diffusion facilitator family transporter [Azospirillum sp. SYSU D00513]
MATIPGAGGKEAAQPADGHGHSHDHEHGHNGSHGNAGHSGQGHGHGDHDGHAGHSHTPAVTEVSERKVFWVMLLTGGFMVAEVVGGIASGSLALLADAGHMLTDSAALALAWFAFRLGRRPADARRSYGYHRFQVLAAYTNGISLFAIALWIAVEAIGRFYDPVEVMGAQMLVIATLGLLVNVVSFWVLHRGGEENLNVRGAAIHVLGDLLGSVGAIAAALIILWTGWMPIDPILSVVVVLLILRSAWKVTKESAHILLEGTPEGLDMIQVGAAVRAVPGVLDVQHIHAWSLTGERRLITLHAFLEEAANPSETIIAINHTLKEQFGIDHATVQLERGTCFSVQKS